MGERVAALALATTWMLVCGVAAAEPSASGYVGDAVCTSCHAEALEEYRHTIHAKVLNDTNARSVKQRRGCESCHGPGAAHVEAGGGEGVGGPRWISFSEQEEGDAISRQNEACLDCHRGGSQRFWPGSPHANRQLRCGDCHRVMEKVSDEHLLSAKTQTAQCSGCHRLPRAQMTRTAHMPTRRGALREGWMDCGDCHNPHGSLGPRLIEAASINQSCYGCHADKRGPFLWEHAPVTEDCTNCHHPHGSINPAMLKVSPTRLCQSCHIGVLHPSEARLPGSRFVRGRACGSCHVQVHGSNHPSGVGLTR